jgi:hypothetical protein
MCGFTDKKFTKIRASVRNVGDMPRTQPLAAKEVTSRRKEIVQRIRPWQKAPTFLKAQEKAQKAVVQRKKRGKAQA